MLVGVDDPRRGMVLPTQGFGQKALGRRCIAFGREKEVDRRTGGVGSGATLESNAVTDLNSKHTNNKAVEQTDPRRCTSARLVFADHVDYLEGRPAWPANCRWSV